MFQVLLDQNDGESRSFKGGESWLRDLDWEVEKGSKRWKLL